MSLSLLLPVVMVESKGFGVGDLIGNGLDIFDSAVISVCRGYPICVCSGAGVGIPDGDV